jgi:hypothetical protein
MNSSLSLRSPLFLASIALMAGCAEAPLSENNDSLAEGDTAIAPSAATMASYPCNGTTTGYDVVGTLSGSTWTVKRGTTTKYTGTDMAAAMLAAMNALTAGRTYKESILIQGSGNYPATTRNNIPSYTVLNVCGTINVTGSASGDYAPIYARDKTQIEIPNVKITGSPSYGILFKNVSSVNLGVIDIRTTSGLGVRVDNTGASGRINGLTINSVYGSGMKSHLVETYGINSVSIGTVTGSSVGECGLLLNDTANANVGTVSCTNCATGTGYAAFRIANNAGKIGSDWPAGNIRVSKVYARGGGRGIFAVSGSGGLTIDTIDIADTGNNPILLQNCINTTLGAASGKISKGSAILGNDTTNTNNGLYQASRNVTLKNIALSNGATLSEQWCQLGDRGNRAVNVTGGTVTMCYK